ncbi:MAG: ribbon-helix-helix domain-containing protein [Candidatus Bathyarchaeota archaeon]|nr:ribbon-helix-helix domain-containing protein [Candidatus Bathyarchaeum sp.]
MPVKGYDSVNVPSGLYKKIRALIQNRSDLGYRSVTEFVAEAVRTKLIDIGETAP